MSTITEPSCILPPGAKSPAWWQLFSYSHSPLRFLEDASRRYGTPFTMRLVGFSQAVMLTDPRAVQDVFRGKATALHAGEAGAILSPIIGPNSVVVLDEQPHARQRAVLLPALNGERMRMFFDAMQTETVRVVNSWPIGQPIRTLPYMRRITLRVILRSVLGISPGPELDTFETLVDDLVRSMNSWYFFILIRTNLIRSSLSPLRRRLLRLDQAIYKFIARRRREFNVDRAANILDDLLTTRSEDGRLPSDEEIRDAILTIMMAGYETTSIALTWALEQIVPRSDVVEAITAELRDVAPTTRELPSVGKWPFLDAAIRESLRRRTMIPYVLRLTKSEFRAGDRVYPPGVFLAPCIHLIHRREDLYPNPERFDPSRFLTRKYSADEWLPFGGGDRMCIGMTFALAELRIVLATILPQVRLERPAGTVSYPVHRGLILAPHDDCVVVVRERLIRDSRKAPDAASNHAPSSKASH